MEIDENELDIRLAELKARTDKYKALEDRRHEEDIRRRLGPNRRRVRDLIPIVENY
ncbi:MAG: hypothetical protein ABII07_00850 [Patescibacteria group bacterium]|nr:hypothetical protein [Patescibacteria group bacterium]